MAENSKIEWTGASWTPIRARNKQTGKVGWHCEHATTGCEFCYAEARNRWTGSGLPFKPGHRKDIEIFLDEEMLTAPLRWRKPRMIFVCSMTDLFADFVADAWIDRIFAVMALCPQHTFQVLTKRADRMRAYYSSSAQTYEGAERRDDVAVAAFNLRDQLSEGKPENTHTDEACLLNDERWSLSNVWIGVSAERQREWDERKRHLRNTPAAVRFCSFEPLLEGVVEPNMAAYLDWAIVGGESGSRARPMHPQWVRDICDQCNAASVAFFFKQWGEWQPSDDLDVQTVWSREQATVLPDGRVREWQPGFPKARLTDPRMRGMTRIGKKRAGRLLDGREWNEFPQIEKTGVTAA